MNFFKKNRDLWLSGAIIVLALGLRLPLLNGSFWLDEAAQALESARPLAQQFEIIPDFQPPLLHLILHFALYLSDNEAWLRMIGAVIPGIITIWATIWLGRRLQSPQAGWLAGLLLATSSFHIFYSQELRPYALPAMWAVLSWVVLLKDWPKKDSVRQWLWFSLVTTLGLYSSFLYPFLVIGQVGWVIWLRREWIKPMLISLAMAGVMFGPWLPIFQQQLAAGGVVRQDLPGWSEVVSIPQVKSLPLVAGKFIFGVLDLQFSVGFGVVSVVLLGAAAGLILHWWLKAKSKKADRDSVWLLLIWLIIPLITAWVISFWIPVVQPKRVLFLLPAFYLLVSVVTDQITARWLKYSLLGLLLAVNLYSTAAYYLQPIYQRENWRVAHQEILRKYPADQSVAVFVFPEPFAPWRWYDDGSYPTWSTGTLHISQVPDLRDRLEKITTHKYLIVFDYLRDLSDPEDQILQEIQAFGYKEVELIDYPNIGFIRVFARTETVIGWRPDQS